MVKGAIPPNARWLAVVGTIGLVIGLFLVVVDEPGLRTDLVLLAGSIPWVLFFVMNQPWEDRASALRDDESLPR